MTLIPQQLVPGKFAIDGGTETPAWLEGFHDPTVRWNGWACPYFDAEQRDAVIAHMNQNGSTCRFDPETEQVHTWFEASDTEDIDAPVEVNGEKYWPIGAFGWCWNEEQDFSSIASDQEKVSKELTAKQWEDVVEACRYVWKKGFGSDDLGQIIEILKS